MAQKVPQFKMILHNIFTWNQLLRNASNAQSQAVSWGTFRAEASLVTW